MKKIFKSYLIIIFFITISCSWSKFYGDVNLGGNYILNRDGNYRAIMYNPNKKNNGYGVINQNIRFVNYNDSFIIAKSIEYVKTEGLKLEYWIIDKRKPVILKNVNTQSSFDSLLRVNLTGPLDSLEFYRLLKINRIELELKEVR